MTNGTIALSDKNNYLSAIANYLSEDEIKAAQDNPLYVVEAVRNAMASVAQRMKDANIDADALDLALGIKRDQKGEITSASTAWINQPSPLNAGVHIDLPVAVFHPPLDWPPPVVVELMTGVTEALQSSSSTTVFPLEVKRDGLEGYAPQQTSQASIIIPASAGITVKEAREYWNTAVKQSAAARAQKTAQYVQANPDEEELPEDLKRIYVSAGIEQTEDGSIKITGARNPARNPGSPEYWQKGVEEIYRRFKGWVEQAAEPGFSEVVIVRQEPRKHEEAQKFLQKLKAAVQEQAQPQIPELRDERLGKHGFPKDFSIEEFLPKMAEIGEELQKQRGAVADLFKKRGDELRKYRGDGLEHRIYLHPDDKDGVFIGIKPDNSWFSSADMWSNGQYEDLFRSPDNQSAKPPGEFYVSGTMARLEESEKGPPPVQEPAFAFRFEGDPVDNSRDYLGGKKPFWSTTMAFVADGVPTGGAVCFPDMNVIIYTGKDGNVHIKSMNGIPPEDSTVPKRTTLSADAITQGRERLTIGISDIDNVGCEDTITLGKNTIQPDYVITDHIQRYLGMLLPQSLVEKYGLDKFGVVGDLSVAFHGSNFAPWDYSLWESFYQRIGVNTLGPEEKRLNYNSADSKLPDGFVAMVQGLPESWQKDLTHRAVEGALGRTEPPSAAANPGEIIDNSPTPPTEISNAGGKPMSEGPATQRG